MDRQSPRIPRGRDDVDAAYENLANAYVTKPVDFEQFASVFNAIDAFWFQTAKLPSPGNSRSKQREPTTSRQR